MCFTNYIKAGYPLLWIKTHEEQRVLIEYVSQISKLKLQEGQIKYTTAIWDVADGVRTCSSEAGNFKMSAPVEDTKHDPLAPIKWLDSREEPFLNAVTDNTILFLLDYGFFLQKEFQDSNLIMRKIRNVLSRFKAQGRTLVIISPNVQIPSELDKEVSVINYKLPSRDELRKVLNGVGTSIGYKFTEDSEPLIDAACGLTSSEAESAFALSLIEVQKFDPKVIRREKSTIVKKTGLLEVVETTNTIADIGGLENMKDWLTARKDCFAAKARDFGITPPKGMLLVGVPGSGKSLSVKAIGSIWGRPILRLDMGRIFGSYVGESENNMHRCLDIAAAVSPCVLWIDELEKSMSGNKNGQESHETTRRVFQLLLTWMQERTSDVFLAATANSVQSLPPELLRAGRIDVIFWVDLPDSVQRSEIIKIHLKKLGRDPNLFGKDITKLVKLSEGFTGAELEVWIKESLVRAFSLGHPEVTLEDLSETVKDITPISQLMKADIDNARQWAVSRGTKMASIAHDVKEVAESKPRKIEVNLQQ